jgi:hypothetical protein
LGIHKAFLHGLTPDVNSGFATKKQKEISRIPTEPGKQELIVPSQEFYRTKKTAPQGAVFYFTYCI